MLQSPNAAFQALTPNFTQIRSCVCPTLSTSNPLPHFKPAPRATRVLAPNHQEKAGGSGSQAPLLASLSPPLTEARGQGWPLWGAGCSPPPAPLSGLWGPLERGFCPLPPKTASPQGQAAWHGQAHSALSCRELPCFERPPRPPFCP